MTQLGQLHRKLAIGIPPCLRTAKQARRTSQCLPPSHSSAFLTLKNSSPSRNITGLLGPFRKILLWALCKTIFGLPSETFSFVLTELDGSKKFGYCRRLLADGDSPRFPEVYCIVSEMFVFQSFSSSLKKQLRCFALGCVITVALSVCFLKCWTLWRKGERPPQVRFSHF